MRLTAFLLVALAGAAIGLSGCGGSDDDTPEDEPTSSPSGSAGPASPTATPAINLTPPLEGPDRGAAPTERTNFRESPEWQLPNPEDLPPVPDDEDDAIFDPPNQPACPDDWTVVLRPSEGFNICHPVDWQTAGNGYVSGGAEDRWYSHGIVKFADENLDRVAAHVSVYVMNPYARPMVYTRDCPRPYSLTFAGSPAVICPAFPAELPEEDFTSYHIRRGDLDYFVQIVTFEGSEDSLQDIATEIAHSFQLTDLPATQ